MSINRPSGTLRALIRIGIDCALVTAALGTWTANAFPIDTGNPDLELRWDNSVRYNLGVRARAQDPNILNNTSYDNSDSKFKRGDIVTNRLDLLTESDLVYRKRSGLRVSAALWYDQAYRNVAEQTANSNFVIPGLGDISSAYPDNTYTRFTRRWNRGPSGEILDAFVFTRFVVGTVPVNVKLGQHTIYWGESLFSFVHGVSYAQGPIDIRKVLANPGVEAKEVFKPLPQLSATIQLTDVLSMAGQYYLGWKPSAFPDGGTYFGLLDALTRGGGTYLVNPAQAAAISSALGGTPVAAVPFIPSYRDPKKTGDWGVMARWSPGWLTGTAALYFRKYTDKLPQIVLGGLQAAPLALGVPVPSSLGFSYQEKQVTLVGASFSRAVEGVSVSGEIAHRIDTPLLMGPATVLGSEPTGDTTHALVNALAYIGRIPAFDSATLAAELTYSHLDKVKNDPANFNSVDYGCKGAAEQLGCATRNAWGFTVRFVPTWFQVVPGVDLSMPLLYSVGLKGTSPVLFGGYQGNSSYSAGLALDVKANYSLTLAYNGAYAKHHNNSVNALGQQQVGGIGGIGAQWDRGWVSFTFKTTF
ncbi:MAG: hypothetical protein JWQ89_2751 [Devosia sp.]|uniref:DUF1302 domain-containing protein n=1 Tax=Devosia sp. TaxID=1871048 RepID=UPI002635DF6B|nr:DUF1302 domain-containing protein [Devosia sp.]MDB5541024.1 hypothetical protein [Devosia sp.]